MARGDSAFLARVRARVSEMDADSSTPESLIRSGRAVQALSMKEIRENPMNWGEASGEPANAWPPAGSGGRHMPKPPARNTWQGFTTPLSAWGHPVRPPRQDDFFRKTTPTTFRELEEPEYLEADFQ